MEVGGKRRNLEQSYVGQYTSYKKGVGEGEVNGPTACFMSTLESYVDQDDRWQWGGGGGGCGAVLCRTVNLSQSPYVLKFTDHPTQKLDTRWI